jgi:hypothetical protein
MDTTSLANTAQARMEHARSAARGRSAQTVHGGHDRALRQTVVVALRAGTTLHEHHSSREATLQVLAGRVRLTGGTQVAEAVAGDLPHGARRGPHTRRTPRSCSPSRSRSDRPGRSPWRPAPAPVTPGRRTGRSRNAPSREPGAARARISLRIPKTARTVGEPHRAATQLELLFDLTFVVAVAAVVTQLGHGVAEGHAAEVVGPFLPVFFAIWWAWMNFTRFASSHDTDDVPYRLLTLPQPANPARTASDAACVTRNRLRRSHERPRLPLDLAETVLTFARHGWSESHGNG